MMMISNRQSAPLARARRARLVVFGVLVLLLAAAALWRAPLSEWLWRAAAPLMAARYSDSGAAALASTTALLADREALYQENLDLKARLGRPGTAPVRIVGAVLLRPPATPYDTLVIDVGTAEHVAAGEYVSAGGGALIGTVSEVYEHAARVKLFSAPGERFDALLDGRLPVAIEGQGGGSMTAQMPSGTAVSTGDTAIVPSIAGGLAARVTQVDKTEASFVTIYFQLPANLFMLRFVEVWKNTP